MVQQKRDRLEVIYDILMIIKNNGNSIKTTPLQRFSNLSFSSYSMYYLELLEKELIKEILDKNNRKFITLTDKGFLFIEKYKFIKGFLKDFGLE